MRALRYAFDEAVAQLMARTAVGRCCRRPRSPLALFVLGGFLIVTANLAAPRRRVEQRRGNVGLSGRRRDRRSSGTRSKAR